MKSETIADVTAELETKLLPEIVAELVALKKKVRGS